MSSMWAIDSGTYVMIVPGEPVPAARARVVRGHAYIPPRTAEHITLIRDTARMIPPPRDGQQASVICVFYCKERRRKDLDNLLKAVMDGLHPHPLADDDVSHVHLVAARAIFVPAYAHTRVYICYSERGEVASGIELLYSDDTGRGVPRGTFGITTTPQGEKANGKDKAHNAND